MARDHLHSLRARRHNCRSRGGVRPVHRAARHRSLPTYQDRFTAFLNDLEAWLATLGIGREQLNAALGQVSFGRIAGLFTDLLVGLAGAFSNLLLLLLIVLFMGLDATHFSRRLARVGGKRKAIVSALGGFVHGTRTYLVVSTIFGLIVAAIDTAFLWIVGVPLAVLWGLLAFVTNYIPNVGFLIGLVPPALLALLEGGPQLMISVIVAYSVINFVIQSVIQPKFVGDAVNLSLTLTFLSLLFWSFAIGPLGAVLAIPLTLLAKALLLDVDPDTRWISGLLASGSAPQAPVDFMQADNAEDGQAASAGDHPAPRDGRQEPARAGDRCRGCRWRAHAGALRAGSHRADHSGITPWRMTTADEVCSMLDGAGSPTNGAAKPTGFGNHLARAVRWHRSPPTVLRPVTALTGVGRNIMSVPVASAVTGTQRIAAAVALLSAGLTVLLAVTVAVIRFPSGLGVLVCVVVAMAAAWFAVVRRGSPRVIGTVIALVALAGAGVLLIRNSGWGFLVGLVIGVAIFHAAARAAFRVHLRLPVAEPPQRPVLFINPWSGGGKAAKVGLAGQAAQRGIRTVELHRGDDLEQLVTDAVASGADGLAAAGGDGTQAIVATAAAQHGLPYACIPAGTRNHFALDLGVDRDDVVGALDAFVDGGEHLVDLGEVNGRVFVNNVSMGLYAEAVQSKGYRDAKIRTLLDTVPAAFGPTGSELDLRWVSPDGAVHSSAATILVSNNAYRLGHVVGSGTRPRIDTGRLGIAVVPARGDDGGRRHAASPLRQWSTAEFEVDSAHPIPLGIDGEAFVLDPPVRFRIRPRTLRVRISPRHPGASPSAMEPDRFGDSVRALAAIAAGRLPTTPSRAG